MRRSQSRRRIQETLQDAHLLIVSRHDAGLRQRIATGDQRPSPRPFCQLTSQNTRHLYN